MVPNQLIRLSKSLIHKLCKVHKLDSHREYLCRNTNKCHSRWKFRLHLVCLQCQLLSVMELHLPIIRLQVIVVLRLKPYSMKILLIKCTSLM